MISIAEYVSLVLILNGLYKREKEKNNAVPKYVSPKSAKVILPKRENFECATLSQSICFPTLHILFNTVPRFPFSCANMIYEL